MWPPLLLGFEPLNRCGVDGVGVQVALVGCSLDKERSFVVGLTIAIYFIHLSGKLKLLFDLVH